MKGFILAIALFGLILSGEFAGAQTKAPSSAKSGMSAPRAAARSSAAPKGASAKASAKAPAKKRVYRPAPKVDPTIGDNMDGEDLAVRRAAVEALGSMNGSVVAVDTT